MSATDDLIQGYADYKVGCMHAAITLNVIMECKKAGYHDEALWSKIKEVQEKLEGLTK